MSINFNAAGDYEMASDVWIPVEQIRWPNPMFKRVQIFHSVAAISDNHQITPRVQEILRDNIDEVRMGELNGRLSLLIQAELLLSDDLREFVVAHEAFHIAAQYYGSRIALERIGKIEPYDLGSINRFWNEVSSLARSSLMGSKSHGCGNLQKSFASLSSQDRRYVLGKAYWEWPAEYYARESVIPNMSHEDYLRLRNRIPGDNHLYTSGATAMRAVSNVYGQSKDWQASISGGESSLDIFMSAMGCDRLDKAKGFGLIRRTDFLPH